MCSGLAALSAPMVSTSVITRKHFPRQRVLSLSCSKSTQITRWIHYQVLDWRQVTAQCGQRNDRITAKNHSNLRHIVFHTNIMPKSFEKKNNTSPIESNICNVINNANLWTTVVTVILKRIHICLITWKALENQTDGDMIWYVLSMRQAFFYYNLLQFHILINFNYN